MATRKNTAHFKFNMGDMLDKAKSYMKVEYAEDDEMIERLIQSAIAFAEKQQHYHYGHYQTNRMRPDTELAVYMHVTLSYESRDGGTGGFYGDRPDAVLRSWQAIERLLAGDRRAVC